jgi:hypothetical protein
MNGEPLAAAQTKRITERDDVDTSVPFAGADHFTCSDGDSRRGEAHLHMLEVHRGGGRLRRRPKAGEALLARLDVTTRADADEVRSEETRSFLRGLRVQPLVFDAEDGLGHSRGLGLRLSLRGRAGKQQDREQQTEENPLHSQILMKIFLR